MKRFDQSALNAINSSEHTGMTDAEWLKNAESSISYLKTNIENDEVVIYATGKCIGNHPPGSKFGLYQFWIPI